MKSIILCLALILVGCSTNRQLHSFHFPPGKTTPSCEDTNRFRGILATLKANTNATLMLNGNLYPENKKLTEQRVWMVLNALSAADVDLGRIYFREDSEYHNRSHIPNNQWFTVLIVF